MGTGRGHPRPDGDGDRIISLAITPVVGEKRVRTGELYVETNPGVPTDARSTAVHGFTTEAVARKRRFGHYAPRSPARCSPPAPATPPTTSSSCG